MEKLIEISEKIHYSYICEVCAKGVEFDININSSVDTDSIKADSDKGSSVFFSRNFFINNGKNTNFVIVTCPDCGCNMTRVNSDFYPLCKEFIKKGYTFNAAGNYNNLCGELDELNEKGETKLVRYYQAEVIISRIFSDIEFRFLDDDNWDGFVNRLTPENKEYLDELKSEYGDQDCPYEFFDYEISRIYDNLIDNDVEHKLFSKLFKFPEVFNTKIRYNFVNSGDDDAFIIMADDENNYRRWLNDIPDLTDPNNVVDLVRRYKEIKYY